LVEVKISPTGPSTTVWQTAVNIFPSAEEATEVQNSSGTLLDIQVIPEFVEVYSLLATATNLVPSDEEAIPFTASSGDGILFDVQVAPALVETKKCRDPLTYTSYIIVPLAEDATDSVVRLGTLVGCVQRLPPFVET
jgi:hypothetical protein